MARKTRKIKRSRSRRKSRQVKRSRTRRVKRSRRTRRVKRSRRKVKGGAFPVVGMAALALLGAGSVAAKKLMDRSKSPEPLTNDDMQRYSDMSSYGHKLRERYEPSATDVAIDNSRKRRVEEDAEYERKRSVIATNNQKKLEKSNRKQAAEEKRKAMVAERRTAAEASTEASEEPRLPYSWTDGSSAIIPQKPKRTDEQKAASLVKSEKSRKRFLQEQEQRQATRRREDADWKQERGRRRLTEQRRLNYLVENPTPVVDDGWISYLPEIPDVLGYGSE